MSRSRSSRKFSKDAIKYLKEVYTPFASLPRDVREQIITGLMEFLRKVIEGRGEVRAVFPTSKGAKVAGVYVTEGKISRGASVRVRRGAKIVNESTVSSLKRFKDDVREVAAGYECGVGIKDFSDFQVGDVLETFRMEQVS